jgi:hypothetical protein
MDTTPSSSPAALTSQLIGTITAELLATQKSLDAANAAIAAATTSNQNSKAAFEQLLVLLEYYKKLADVTIANVALGAHASAVIAAGPNGNSPTTASVLAGLSVAAAVPVMPEQAVAPAAPVAADPDLFASGVSTGATPPAAPAPVSQPLNPDEAAAVSSEEATRQALATAAAPKPAASTSAAPGYTATGSSTFTAPYTEGTTDQPKTPDSPAPATSPSGAAPALAPSGTVDFSTYTAKDPQPAPSGNTPPTGFTTPPPPPPAGGTQAPTTDLTPEEIALLSALLKISSRKLKEIKDISPTDLPILQDFASRSLVQYNAMVKIGMTPDVAHTSILSQLSAEQNSPDVATRNRAVNTFHALARSSIDITTAAPVPSSPKKEPSPAPAKRKWYSVRKRFVALLIAAAVACGIVNSVSKKGESSIEPAKPTIGENLAPSTGTDSQTPTEQKPVDTKAADATTAAPSVEQGTGTQPAPSGATGTDTTAATPAPADAASAAAIPGATDAAPADAPTAENSAPQATETDPIVLPDSAPNATGNSATPTATPAPADTSAAAAPGAATDAATAPTAENPAPEATDTTAIVLPDSAPDAAGTETTAAKLPTADTAATATSGTPDAATALPPMTVSAPPASKGFSSSFLGGLGNVWDVGTSPIVGIWRQSSYELGFTNDGYIPLPQEPRDPNQKETLGQWLKNSWTGDIIGGTFRSLFGAPAVSLDDELSHQLGRGNISHPSAKQAPATTTGVHPTHQVTYIPRGLPGSDRDLTSF